MFVILQVTESMLFKTNFIFLCCCCIPVLNSDISILCAFVCTIHLGLQSFGKGLFFGSRIKSA